MAGDSVAIIDSVRLITLAFSLHSAGVLAESPSGFGAFPDALFDSANLAAPFFSRADGLLITSAEATSPNSGIAFDLAILDQRAWNEDYRLKVLEAELDLTQAQRRDSVAFPTPELRLTSESVSPVDGLRSDWQGAVRINLPRPLEFRLDLKQASQRIDGARVAIEVRKREIQLELRESLVALYLLEEKREVTKKAEAQRLVLSQLVQKSLEAGRTTRLEEALVQLKLEEARQDAREAAASLEKALRALVTRLDLEASSAPELLNLAKQQVTIREGIFPKLPESAILLELALNYRAEMIQAKKAIVDARLGVREARIQLIPTASFVQIDPPATTATDPATTGWAVTAAIELPLPAINSAGVMSARAATVVLERQLELEVTKITREIYAARQDVQNAAAGFAAYSPATLVATERASASIKAAVEAGRVDVAEAIILDEKTSAALMKRLDLLERYYQTMAALWRTVGVAILVDSN